MAVTLPVSEQKAGGTQPVCKEGTVANCSSQRVQGWEDPTGAEKDIEDSLCDQECPLQDLTPEGTCKGSVFYGNVNEESV